MVLRASKNIPQMDGRNSRSELGMFLAGAAQATTAAASGPRWRSPPVRDDSLGRPNRARGPPTRTASGLGAAVKERHMRRLAVASALTLPMTVALAPSALAAKPTHQRLPSTPPTPKKRRLSHLHGLTMRTIPETIQVAGNQGNRSRHAREAVNKQRIPSHGDLALRGRRWAVGLAPAGRQDAYR
jgi:hypothetical protein